MEEDVAAKLGGRRRAASGAVPSWPGDVKFPGWLCECKWTGKQRFAITRKLWDKIHTEAVKSGLEPCMVVKFEDGPSVAVLDFDLFCSIVKERGGVLA